MGLVPVHAPEDDLALVDQELVAVDPHRAEAERQAYGLAGGAHLRDIAPRHLGAPRLDGPDRDRRQRSRAGELRAYAQLGDLDRHRIGALVRGDLRHDRAGAVRAGAVQIRGPQPDVGQRAAGAAEQGHGPEDARQPPLVLVLQIAARGPLVHPDQQDVLTRADQFGDVELGHQTAAGRDADLGAVQPDPVGRLGAVEAEQDPLHVPVREVERTPVVARRVLVGHVRRVDRKGVLHVGVDRLAVRTAGRQDPVRGHRDRVPVGVVVVGRRGRLVQPVRNRRPAEPPLPVEAELRGVADHPGPRAAEQAAVGVELLEVVTHPPQTRTARGRDGLAPGRGRRIGCRGCPATSAGGAGGGLVG